MKIHFELQTIIFHIHLGLKLVNGLLSNGVGRTEFTETLHGRIIQSFIENTYTNDSDSASDQLDHDLEWMRLTDTSEKVSDDDFYVDDFESDKDGDGEL